MCGIAGILSREGIDQKDLEAMSFSLRHRGPDGYGFMVYSLQRGMQLALNRELGRHDARGNILGFAHRRLSILDLSVANIQPMVDISGEYCLIYNGEVYNYQELRMELERLGQTFRTAGDTEVLLQAYKTWGLDFLQRLNGMWALALFDSRRQRLIVSRDRFGIKPLYYTVQNNSLYFASEIKALLAVPSMKCEPNEKIVARYLVARRSDDTEETFFEGIYQFRPAHYAIASIRDGTLNFREYRYWSFPEERAEWVGEEAVDQFKGLLIDSIRIHTHSDVPVGTCLSGGLDSSSIVCVADLLRRRQEIPNYTHWAFGYVSDDEVYSEKRFMDVVASSTGAVTRYVHFNADQFGDALSPILWAQDEPFGSASIVAQWFVFQTAKANGMKVMLDGQGADETLAGYLSYLLYLLMGKLVSGKLAEYRTLRFQYTKELGPFPSCVRAILFLLLQRYFPSLALFVQYLSKSMVRFSTEAALAKTLTQFVPLDFADRPASLNKRLQQDIEAFVLPGLLRYEDRNSMVHSIEARVPFLDYRLVEFLFKLPEEWKIRGVTTKYILREALRGVLPENVRTRMDKIGFRASPGLTFSYVRKNEGELVRNESDFEHRWFKPKGVERFLRNTDESVDNEFDVWRIVNTKLWARQFWGKRAPEVSV